MSFFGFRVVHLELATSKVDYVDKVLDIAESSCSLLSKLNLGVQ